MSFQPPAGMSFGLAAEPPRSSSTDAPSGEFTRQSHPASDWFMASSDSVSALCPRAVRNSQPLGLRRSRQRRCRRARPRQARDGTASHVPCPLSHADGPSIRRRAAGDPRPSSSTPRHCAQSCRAAFRAGRCGATAVKTVREPVNCSFQGWRSKAGRRLPSM